MSSRREVLIRILALFWREDVYWNKKSQINVAIDVVGSMKKGCSVDGGRGICPLFSSPGRGIRQLKRSHPQEFALQGKNANARGSARGGGRLGSGGIDWCITAIDRSV